MPSKTHIVKKGETFAKVAFTYGFANWRALYDHPENGELKARRPNPNILYPGDRIVIPDKSTKEETGNDGQKHRFRRKGEGLWLRLMIRDTEDQPVADTPYVLHVENISLQGQTDKKGLLEHRIPETAENGVLQIAKWALSLNIGHLDPVDTVSGWQGRLRNLGYRPGPVNGKTTDTNGVERDDLKGAVEEFQRDNPLSVDGIAGPITQARLEKVHGC